MAGTYFDGPDGANHAVSDLRPLPVRTANSASAFGEGIVAQLDARIQADAVYGIRATDVETFTATGGSATAANNLWNCQTGTSVGGYGVIRSERAVRYRPGMGSRFRFTAAFTTGVALSIQWAGVFSSVDYLGFGYNGTSFGVCRREPGALEIQTLTLTAAATGNETGTVTLNGTAFPIAITSGDVQQGAREVVAGFSSTDWEAYATNDQIVFVALTAEVKSAGAFSYSSDGGSAGTMVETVTGAANDNDTGHVAQASFNINTASWLNPAGLNIYEIEFGYLGAASTTFRVYNPATRHFEDVHSISYANDPDAVQTSVSDPTLKVGYISASLGSTTNLSVRGGSMLGAVEGTFHPMRNPRGFSHTQTSVSTEVNVLSIRNAREFNGVLNQQEILPIFADVAVAGTKPAEIRVYLNATVADAEWLFEDEDVSIAHTCVTKGAVSGGREIAAAAVFGGGDHDVDFRALFVHVEPTETLTIAVVVEGGAGSDVSVGMTWLED